MNRDEVVQRSPGQNVDLTNFPSKHLREGTLWRRAHRIQHGPWYYASHGGRFDLPEPYGTCYLATTAETAAREVIGPDFVASGAIPDTFLAARVVSEVLLPRAATAAKLTSDAAFRYRISNELCSMSDYSIPQQWAGAFHSSSFDGIWYKPRFSPGSGRALAIFGDAGAAAGDSHNQTSLTLVVNDMPDINVVCTGRLIEYEILDRPQQQ